MKLPGSRVMRTNWRKKQTKKILFWSNIAIYLFQGLYKGRSSYRSLQPSKENIQQWPAHEHQDTKFLLTFFLFLLFVDHDPDQGPHWIWICNTGTKTTFRIALRQGCAVYYIFCGSIIDHLLICDFELAHPINLLICESGMNPRISRPNLIILFINFCLGNRNVP